MELGLEVVIGLDSTVSFIEFGKSGVNVPYIHVSLLRLSVWHQASWLRDCSSVISAWRVGTD